MRKKTKAGGSFITHPLKPSCRRGSQGDIFAVLFSFCFMLALNAWSQKDNQVEFKNITTREAFNILEKKTGLSFVYSESLVDVNHRVDLSLIDFQLDKALTAVLKGTNVRYLVKDKHIVLTVDPVTPAEASPRVMGVVTNAKTGEPMGGATITVKGSAAATMSNGDGRFGIAIPNKNASLVVSLVGFVTREVKLNGLGSVEIALDPKVKGLDEVVVTAYSTSKRSAIAGSVSVVSAEELEKNQATNISSTLQGLVPGLQVVQSSGQPGATQDILIRGLGSMSASSSPLYVVDGIPYDLSLNSIPTAEIQSVSVLKDASAASLYGAHAANGVVLITTKRASSGKPRIEFYSILSTSELAVPYPKKVSVQKQWETVWKGLYNDGTDFLNMSDAEARQNATDNVSGAFYNPMPFTLPNGTERQYRSGWNTDFPIGLDGKVKPDAQRLWDFDNYAYLFKHRLSQNYGINGYGSFNENSKYTFSLSGLSDKGSYIGDNFSQVNGRLGLDSKLAKWLDLSSSVLFSSSNNKNADLDIRPMRMASREQTYFIYDHINNTYKSRPYIPDQLAIDNSSETGRIAYGGYAMSLNLYDKKNDITQNLSMNVSLKAKILPALSFKTVFSYQLYNNIYQRNTPPDNGSLLDQPEWGSIIRSNMNANTRYFNNLLAYDKSLTDVHHVNVLLGQEAYMYGNSYFYEDRGGLALPFFQEIDQATTYPNVSSRSDTYNLFSYFAKAGYDYDNKYFLTASYRRDGSSRFAPDNRWGNFVSAGVAWIVSRENFMSATSSWLTMLKLKASYGQLGNDNIGSYYGYQSFYGVGGNYYGNLGIQPTQLPNPALRWEANISSNVGAEFVLFERLRGSVELFKRKSKDLLLDDPLPTSSGRDVILRNIGELQNTGYEVDLSYDVLKTKYLSWIINGNASSYKNRITALPYGSKMSQTDFNGQGGVAYYKWVVGGSRYDMYASEWAGINPDNGRNQWWKSVFDANGKVVERVKTQNFSEVNSESQRVNAGSSLPKLFGSFGTDLRYKAFDLSAMFIYSLGSKAYDYLYAESSVLRQAWAVYDNIDQAWQKPGDIAYFPKIYEYFSNDAKSRQNIGSSQFIWKNDYLRLKNLIVGYTLPASPLQKLKLQKVRLYLRGENLFTTGVMASHGSDPEAVGVWGQNKSGLTYFGVRKYSFGLNITF